MTLHLAAGNPIDATDTGFVSHYTDASGQNHVAGLIRDADTKQFKFIQSLPAGSLPVDSSGAVVIDPTGLQLAPLVVSELSTLGLCSAQSLRTQLGTIAALSVGDLFASTIGHRSLSIGAEYITAHTTVAAHGVTGTLSTSSVYSSETIEIGPWRLSNVRRTHGGTTHDELVFTHTTSSRSAFRVRQPDANP